MGDACGNLPVHSMANKTASKVGVFFHLHLFAWRPGGHWSNTEQVVDQWQHPGAYSVALDLLHWAMLDVSLQCIRMAIKSAGNGGTFVYYSCLFCLL
jgi:hypothetical protein